MSTRIVVNAAGLPGVSATASRARLRWALAFATIGGVGLYSHCGGAPSASRVLSESARQSLKAIDQAATGVWTAQGAIGEGARPGPSATAAERDAFVGVVRERARLFEEYQRLMADAAGTAFAADAVSSSLRLIGSETRVYFEARRAEADGASRLVVDESFLQERRIEVPAGMVDAADPAGHFIGYVIDHRFDGDDAADEVLMNAFPAGQRDRIVALRRRDAQVMVAGEALSIARLPVSSDLLKAGRGALTLVSGSRGENARCIGLYADSTTEFADAPGDVRFDIQIAADEAGDRRPRVVYQVVGARPDAASRVVAPCGEPRELAWAHADESGAALVPDGVRRGWQCSIQVDRAHRPANGSVVVRVELPYPGCPSLEESLGANR